MTSLFLSGIFIYELLIIQFFCLGLPPSPPSETAPAPRENPVGVVVKAKKVNKLGVGTIAVIALSSAIVLVVCLGALLLVLKFHCCKGVAPPAEAGPVVSTRTKRSGINVCVCASKSGYSVCVCVTLYIHTYIHLPLGMNHKSST